MALCWYNLYTSTGIKSLASFFSQCLYVVCINRNKIYCDSHQVVCLIFLTTTTSYQEIISVYHSLHSPTLADRVSNRVCDALVLFQVSYTLIIEEEFTLNSVDVSCILFSVRWLWCRLPVFFFFCPCGKYLKHGILNR